MGVNVEGSYVNQAAVKLGCQELTSPFIYLGTKVGGTMSQVQACQEVVEKVKTRLSKWKMKTLTIGGRLTLLKYVLAGKNAGRSCWLAIVDEVRALHKKGVYVFDFMNLKLGNVEMVKFRLDRWYEGGILKDFFSRMFALENTKEVTVSSKLNSDNLANSFRRSPRGN
nr:RNA-directed DNA polymerase, eukaryota [Tanacetum cinerariifolium]